MPRVSLLSLMILYSCFLLSISWSYWKLRKDSRSLFWGGRLRRWEASKNISDRGSRLNFFNCTCETVDASICPVYVVFTHFLVWQVSSVCQVTALRRQVRPTSGKVIRKVNLPEPVQDSSHRPPSGRMYSSSNSAPNGTWWVCVHANVCLGA